MSASGGSEMCRLTICGPATTIDVGVPAHVALADMLPTLVRHLGENVAESGLEHGGWVLQRLGAPPFDEDLSVASLGLRDGDVLHLRPRSDQLPPLDFDDLIDGVATGISRRPDRWRPEYTRRLMLWLMVAPLATGCAVLAAAASTLAALVAAGVALLLVLGAAAASRSFDDGTGAGVLGTAAVAYAALAAGIVPAVVASPIGAGIKQGPVLLAAGMVAAAISIVVHSATGARRPGFLAAALASALVAAAGAITVLTPTSLPGTAAILLLVAVPMGGAVPVISFKLAGLHLTPLPNNPDEFQLDLDPEPGAEVLARTAQADRYMTALSVALGVVDVCCLAVLALGSAELPARLLVLATVLVLLLHARVLVSVRQRLAVIVPAVLGIMVLLSALQWRLPEPLRGGALVLVVVTAMATIALYAGAQALPGRRLLPHWGRAGDLVQSLCAVALLPLALWFLGVFELARGFFG